MYKIGAFIFLFAGLVASGSCGAQVFPREGSKLNYRIIGFSFPGANDGKYKLEIAAGHYDTEDSFMRNITVSADIASNEVIAEVPAFGREYTWRVTYENRHKAKNSELHHFRTSVIPEVDTALMRLKVTQPAKKYKDAYVFVDGTRALYDMTGNPVWYLPALDSFEQKGSYVRDLKATSHGTITCIATRGVYEVDYNGKVTWKMPRNDWNNKDSVEFFHHEFTRLADGRYMALGKDTVNWRHGHGDTVFVLAPDGYVRKKGDGMEQQPMAFGTVLEYDAAGRVVWAWHSLDYFRQTDLYFWKGHGNTRERITDVHLNSFYYDERERMVYVSFKGIDRVLKVSYPDGRVVNSYGPDFKQVDPVDSHLLFCGQHCVRASSDGDLYLYNNNDCSESPGPTVLRLRQPGNSGGNKLERIWEYSCSVDSAFVPREPHGAGTRHTVGGSVIELPGSSYLVCAPTAVNELFIISEDKELLWSASPEKTDPDDKSVTKILSYRASLLGRKELEELIWDSEKEL